MTELKTLDEILCTQDDVRDIERAKAVIKNEIIKWVKYLEEDRDRYEGSDASNVNLQMWIKHFFGINEDELK